MWETMNSTTSLMFQLFLMLPSVRWLLIMETERLYRIIQETLCYWEWSTHRFFNGSSFSKVSMKFRHRAKKLHRKKKTTRKKSFCLLGGSIRFSRLKKDEYKKSSKYFSLYTNPSLDTSMSTKCCWVWLYWVYTFVVDSSAKPKRKKKKREKKVDYCSLTLRSLFIAWDQSRHSFEYQQRSYIFFLKKGEYKWTASTTTDK